MEHAEEQRSGAEAPLAPLPSKKGLGEGSVLRSRVVSSPFKNPGRGLDRIDVLAAALAACLVLLPACSSSRIEKENDRLREENQSLRSQVEQLSATNAELNAKLNEAAATRTAPMDSDVLAALPRVASIELGTLTGFFPGDRGKPATSVNVYIRPLDGRQRFTQAVGTLEVEVFLIPPGPGPGRTFTHHRRRNPHPKLDG